MRLVFSSMGPIMQFVRLLVVLSVFACVADSSIAQLPFGSGTTVVKNATVFTDGKIIENCHLLFAGKKIKAVGPDIKIPDDAEVIDGRGKFIVPTLIDSSATMGLASPSTTSRTVRAHFSILDKINLFDVDPFTDAIEQGVTHVYLRNPSTRGVGGQGAGVLLPKKIGGEGKDILLKGSQAIHVKLGTSTGPIGRYSEVKGLGSQLVAAKKYRESWKKYDEKLKEYVEGLKKAAKNGKKKKSSKKKAPKKKDKPGVKPPKKRVSGPSPFFDEDDNHGMKKNANNEPREALDPSEIASWDIWALGNPEDHPVAIARREKAERENHPPEIPGKWLAPKPELHPRRSILDDDGTEPQLQRDAQVNVNDPGGLDILVCEQCGGEIEGQAHHHPKAEGFDFWQFAPAPKRRSPRSKKSSKKSPKRPREPRFNPSLEAMADILEGKMRLRIEVHRAEDIKNLLALLEKYPMEVALEGVTEGYMVAGELAKAQIPVIVFADAVKPIAEKSGGAAGAIPFRFPFPFRRSRSFGTSSSSGGVPVEGEFRLDNAAQMAAKGVSVTIAASRTAADASPQLLLAAGRVAGNGLPKEKALTAITANPAHILGIDQEIGTLKKGLRASFVVLDGDPFDPTTRVRTIYIDGKRYYKKK